MTRRPRIGSARRSARSFARKSRWDVSPQTEPLATVLESRIIGQERVTDSLTCAFPRVLAGLRDPGRPVLSHAVAPEHPHADQGLMVPHISQDWLLEPLNGFDRGCVKAFVAGLGAARADRATTAHTSDR